MKNVIYVIVSTLYKKEIFHINVQRDEGHPLS
jgi:hypothetical protein